MNFLINVFSSLSQSNKHHSGGWTNHWLDITNSAYLNDNNAEREGNYFFEHGVNYANCLNIFGGFNDINSLKILKFIDSWNNDSTIYSCDIPMPNYDVFLLKRLNCKSTSKILTESVIVKFGKIINNADTVRSVDFVHINKACIGDSHTIAYADSGSGILKENGKTLYGALKSGFLVSQIESLKNNINTVDICLGSVDVRHHLLRHENPIKIIENMMIDLKKIQERYDHLTFNFCAPVPVEYEDRPIPKTGYYKNSPYYGLREDRLKLTIKFINLLVGTFGSQHVIHPPKEWYIMDPVIYAKKHMESNKSVHIAPHSYRRNNWGIKDCKLFL